MDESHQRTIAMLVDLDELMSLYRLDSANEAQHAKIVSTLRWINNYLDPTAIEHLLNHEIMLRNGKAILELLNEPLFKTQ